MTQENLLATKANFSQDDKQLIRNIFDKTNELIYIVNTKDTGIFTRSEFFTAMQWNVDREQGQQRIVYRKVVNTGALPNTGTTNTPHNLKTGGIDNTWDFIDIYLSKAKDPATPRFISGAHPNIAIDIDATNINITTTAEIQHHGKAPILTTTTFI